ncbi:MAG: ABC transporter permease, partial [Deltaproteobacteria bacterium]|nr:ABC transporter permease [Deltaproteobacteria bacterium]
LDDAALGHVEVAAKGWHARRLLGTNLQNPEELLQKLPLPADAEVSARVVVRALASSAHGAQGVLVHGVDPAAERKIAAYLRDIRQGRELDPTDDRGVVVGEGLAERLSLSVGSKLRLTVQQHDGEVGADVFRVRGIFHSIAPAIGKGHVIMTQSAARKLAALPDVVHQVVVQLGDANQAEAVAAAVVQAAGAGVEAPTWGELLPILKSMDNLIGLVQWLIGLFVNVVVGLGILNTMLMSVLERTHELGVLQALGTRPRGIVALIAAESFWIATLAVALGLGLALPLVAWGEQHVLLDFSQAMGEGMEIGGTSLRMAFHTRLSIGSALQSAALVYAMTLAAGLWPAWRVSRLPPATALRSV